MVVGDSRDIIRQVPPSSLGTRPIGKSLGKGGLDTAAMARYERYPESGTRVCVLWWDLLALNLHSDLPFRFIQFLLASERAGEAWACGGAQHCTTALKLNTTT